MQLSSLQNLPQSPMWIQYASIKKDALDDLLFYRMGDFYELFLEDAQEAAAILGITLTARNKNEGQPIPMCGVPHHSATNYINKLLAHGKRVAICEQTEEASATKGIVKREIVRIVSPGMAFDPEALNPSENNYVIALQLLEKGGAFCALDISTGASEYSVFQNHDELRDLLASLKPREVLIPNSVADTETWTVLKNTVGREYFNCVTPAPEFYFSPKAAQEFLCQHFQLANLEAFGLNLSHDALGSVGAIFRRARDTQKLGELKHLQAPLPRINKEYVQIDESTLEHLDLFPKPGQPAQESLFYHLDRTETAPGARMLRNLLTRPSTNLEIIKERQDAVENLLARIPLQDALKDSLRNMLDLERLLAKVGLRTANPRDLLALKDALERLPKIRTALQNQNASLLQRLFVEIKEFPELAQRLATQLREDAPAVTRDGGIFNSGWHSDLDELIQLSDGGKEFLLALETRERESTGISSLKVKFNKVFGYYIEVTNSNLAMVPKHYVRKQTMTGGERYITDELKKFEDKALVAEEKRIALEESLFRELLQTIDGETPLLLRTAKQVAFLDAILSLARAAQEHRYVKPQITDDLILDIQGGRHPTVERLVGNDRFIANDTKFLESKRLAIITGPNMAGKSTYMRQVALITLMAHIGSFVPAKAARIGKVDRIATRVGASDRIGRGQSTFMVEMNEMARILRVSTERSLLLIDEIGRGTSTFDGLALAWAILEDLHSRLRCRTLFATHYHELTMLEDELPGVVNLSVAVKEEGQSIRFLHQVVEGAASGSYGVAVADLAGIPSDVTQRAQSILRDLESSANRRQKQHRQIAQKSQQLSFLGSAPAEAPAPIIPSHLQKLEQALRGLNIDECSPLNALLTLRDLKNTLPDHQLKH